MLIKHPLNFYRSWPDPDTIPENRKSGYVTDNLPKLLMRDQNYNTIEKYQAWPNDEPGFCMLEWDIALATEERQRFAEHALEEPERILVAPYCIYVLGRGATIVHKVDGKPIPEGQAWAKSFGFGCIYFPQSILRRWIDEDQANKTYFGVWKDNLFSGWHLNRYGNVAVDWSVHPQHLHGD